MYVPLILTFVIFNIQHVYVFSQGKPLKIIFLRYFICSFSAEKTFFSSQSYFRRFLHISLFSGKTFLPDRYRISATADLNLVGKTDLSDYDRGITLVAQKSIECMSAFASVSPDGQIHVISSSNMCGIISTPHSSGLWQDEVVLNGSLPGPNVPLNFNFHLSGSQTIRNYRLSDCLPLASSRISLKVTAYTTTKTVYSHIVYQYGKPYSISLHNIESSDAYVMITLVLGVSLSQRYQLSGSLFVRLYRDANNSTYQIDDDVLDILAGRASLVDWESSAKKLYAAGYKILNVLKVLPFSTNIPRTVLDAGLFFDTEFRFNTSKTLTLRAGADRKQLVEMYMTASASASVCGDTTATTDFSNALKLLSITVPKSYIRQQSNFNVTKMWVTFSNFSMPIGEE